jgi:hypothetical protein
VWSCGRAMEMASASLGDTTCAAEQKARSSASVWQAQARAQHSCCWSTQPQNTRRPRGVHKSMHTHAAQPSRGCAPRAPAAYPRW